MSQQELFNVTKSPSFLDRWTKAIKRSPSGEFAVAIRDLTSWFEAAPLRFATSDEADRWKVQHQDRYLSGVLRVIPANLLISRKEEVT